MTSSRSKVDVGSSSKQRGLVAKATLPATGSRGDKWGDGMAATTSHGAVAGDSSAVGEVGYGREEKWWPKERAAVVAEAGEEGELLVEEVATVTGRVLR
ncbi:hypothetical protein BHE74_00052304 [Ensete ventricosum]|nr:hypothetical protein BHE74_00052304 [Ensete ventricosum]